jgi:hypothetical protein
MSAVAFGIPQSRIFIIRPLGNNVEYLLEEGKENEEIESRLKTAGHKKRGMKSKSRSKTSVPFI